MHVRAHNNYVIVKSETIYKKKVQTRRYDYIDQLRILFLEKKLLWNQLTTEDINIHIR